MKKRGQTEVGLGTFLLIVVGVIGLVLVGLFVYNSWSKINKLGDLAPEDRTLYKTACEQAVSIGKTGYCSDFKEVKIEKKTQYMNCEFLNSAYGLDVDATSLGACEGTELEEKTISKGYCTYLVNKKVLSQTNPYVILNGLNCTSTGELKTI